MPNTFKYNTSSIESQSLRKGNFYIGTGDVGKGTSDSTGFYNGFPLGTFSYVIVLHRGGNVPTYYRCQDDAELISRTNQIDTSSVRTTKEQCFSYFASQSDKMVVNKDYQYVVTDGLVLNLDASFLPSFPATGSSWFDLSSSVNNGSLNNSPSWNSAGFFTFDGVNDSISRAYNSSFNIRTGITLSALFRRNSIFTQLSDCFILSRPPAWYFYDAYNSGSIQGEVFIDGIRRGARTVAMPNDGRWYEFVYTYDSSTGWSIMYRNGVSASSTQLTGLSNYLIDSSTANFESIFLNTLGKSYFVNSLKIYNRALSSSEVLQNYYGGPIVTLGLTFAIDASSFVSYDRVGTTWSNLSRNTFNGTFQNSPTFSIVNGGIIDFDGTSAWVEIQTYTFGNGNWTCNIWAQGDNVVYSSSSTGNLISNSSGGPVTNAMGFLSSKIHYRNYDGAWKSNSGNTTLSTGQWYMLTWVNYAGASANLGTMKMFVNGLSDSSVFNSYATNGGPCNAIGRNWFSYFNGRIGLVQFYNVSLTDSQVFENFNAHRSRFNI